jgi:hypothetical protein
MLLCVLTDMGSHIFKVLVLGREGGGEPVSSLPLRRLRQEDQKFKACWGHRVSSSLSNSVSVSKLKMWRRGLWIWLRRRARAQHP